MNIKQFISDYREAFGATAATPIAFWHSTQPVAQPEAVNGCFFPIFEKVRNGEAASFDDITMKCGGGKFYCGLAPMPEHVPTFVSEKEHYKASPTLVKDFIEGMDIKISQHRYINFQRLDMMKEDVDYYGVLIFATPDILSGLVSWACYDNSRPDAVCCPWGSGCSSTVRATINESRTHGTRCFIGLFDPSVRPRVRKDELIFAIPKDRLEEMTTVMRETCLFNGVAWKKVKERICENP